MIVLKVLIGFIPWIIFWIFSGFGNWPMAILGGLITSSVIVSWRRYTRGDSKIIEVVTCCYFIVHTIITLVLDQNILIEYGSVVNNLTLAGMAWGSLAAHSPFTYQYAREEWPHELWSEPLFVRTNQIITAVWGVIFLINTGLGALSILFPQYYLLLNLVIGFTLVGSGILFSSLFPKWFTRYKLQQRIDSRNPWKWTQPQFEVHPKSPAEHDVIVIGSGLGGLTAGALLAHRGLKVALFEQSHNAGGYCTSWRRKVRLNDNSMLHFVFDAGVHDISGLWEHGPVHNVLDQLELEIDWKRMTQEYIFEDLHIRIPEDWREFAGKLGEIFPAESQAIEDFLDEMRLVYHELYADVAITGGVPNEPDTVEALLDYPKKNPHLYRWMKRPFTEVLDHFFSDERLKLFFSSIAAYITDDISALSTDKVIPLFGYYFHGGFYPKGGSQKLSDILSETIISHGGTVYLSSAVDKIIIEDGHATGIRLTKTGEIHRSRAIISNADTKLTFEELVGYEYLPQTFVQQVKDIRPSTSAFAVFLGIDFVPDTAPIIMTDGLGIMIPSLVDPSLSSPGYASMTLVTLLPQTEAQKWDRNDNDYKEMKKAFAATMIDRAKKIFPDLDQHIVYQQEASPRTFERYAWTSGGSIYGSEWRSFRPPLKTPITGLYLAGSGVFPGPGVEAVMISGVLAADAIYKHKDIQT